MFQIHLAGLSSASSASAGISSKQARELVSPYNIHLVSMWNISRPLEH